MLMFVRTVDSLRVSINQYSQHFGTFYIISYLRTGPRSAVGNVSGYRLVSDCLKKVNISDTYYSKKTVFILILFHLFIKSIHW